VRYIGSGRVQVDFNHKYAGRTLIYETNILKTIDSINEKVFQLINRRIPINEEVIDTKSETSTIEVSLPEESFLYEGLQVIKRAIADDIFKFVKEIKTVCFIEKYHSPNEPVATGQTSQSEAKIIEPSEKKAT
jgi:peptidylprolyl isomerase